ncbi:single-stranded DNA-binding protein [Lactococcus lactis]|uniref:single-stranded DNA-binding protein n=1 Tax=Lactococcus lactis TaxID=1358 RepID=UPI0022E0C91C|nr:single-stranded DNA-binding protein [Lactococcus lactis]
MINNVTLVGRITRNPELRYTPQNQAVTTFSLAVNRQFKNANGDRETDFINCVIWRQQAENLANWAKKGALIGITGRIQTRNYENQQGQRVYVTEVVADSFQMLESRQERGNVTIPPPSAAPNNQKQSSPADNHDPFANSELMNIEDDQLPF